VPAARRAEDGADSLLSVSPSVVVIGLLDFMVLGLLVVFVFVLAGAVVAVVVVSRRRAVVGRGGER
jgi:hypothetical protein